MQSGSSVMDRQCQVARRSNILVICLYPTLIFTCEAIICRVTKASTTRIRWSSSIRRPLEQVQPLLCTRFIQVRSWCAANANTTNTDIIYNNRQSASKNNQSFIHISQPFKKGLLTDHACQFSAGLSQACRCKRFSKTAVNGMRARHWMARLREQNATSVYNCDRNVKAII